MDLRTLRSASTRSICDRLNVDGLPDSCKLALRDIRRSFNSLSEQTIVKSLQTIVGTASAIPKATFTSIVGDCLTAACLTGPRVLGPVIGPFAVVLRVIQQSHPDGPSVVADVALRVAEAALLSIARLCPAASNNGSLSFPPLISAAATPTSTSALGATSAARDKLRAALLAISSGNDAIQTDPAKRDRDANALDARPGATPAAAAEYAEVAEAARRVAMNAVGVAAALVAVGAVDRVFLTGVIQFAVSAAAHEVRCVADTLADDAATAAAAAAAAATAGTGGKTAAGAAAGAVAARRKRIDAVVASTEKVSVPTPAAAAPPTGALPHAPAAVAATSRSAAACIAVCIYALQSSPARTRAADARAVGVNVDALVGAIGALAAAAADAAGGTADGSGSAAAASAAASVADLLPQLRKLRKEGSESGGAADDALRVRLMTVATNTMIRDIASNAKMPRRHEAAVALPWSACAGEVVAPGSSGARGGQTWWEVVGGKAKDATVDGAVGGGGKMLALAEAAVRVACARMRGREADTIVGSKEGEALVKEAVAVGGGSESDGGDDDIDDDDDENGLGAWDGDGVSDGDADDDGSGDDDDVFDDEEDGDALSDVSSLVFKPPPGAVATMSRDDDDHSVTSADSGSPDGPAALMRRAGIKLPTKKSTKEAVAKRNGKGVTAAGPPAVGPLKEGKRAGVYTFAPPPGVACDAEGDSDDDSITSVDSESGAGPAALMRRAGIKVQAGASSKPKAADARKGKAKASEDNVGMAATAKGKGGKDAKAAKDAAGSVAGAGAGAAADAKAKAIAAFAAAGVSVRGAKGSGAAAAGGRRDDGDADGDSDDEDRDDDDADGDARMAGKAPKGGNGKAKVSTPAAAAAAAAAKAAAERDEQVDKVARVVRMKTPVERAALRALLAAHAPSATTHALFAGATSKTAKKSGGKKSDGGAAAAAGGEEVATAGVHACVRLCVLVETGYNAYYAEILHRSLTYLRKTEFVVATGLWDVLKIITDGRATDGPSAASSAPPPHPAAAAHRLACLTVDLTERGAVGLRGIAGLLPSPDSPLAATDLDAMEPTALLGRRAMADEVSGGGGGIRRLAPLLVMSYILLSPNLADVAWAMNDAKVAKAGKESDPFGMSSADWLRGASADGPTSKKRAKREAAAAKEAARPSAALEATNTILYYLKHQFLSGAAAIAARVIVPLAKARLQMVDPRILDGTISSRRSIDDGILCDGRLDAAAERALALGQDDDIVGQLRRALFRGTPKELGAASEDVVMRELTRRAQWVRDVANTKM